MESVIRQSMPLALKYVTPTEIDTYLTQLGDKAVCVVGFGMRQHAVESACPVLWVNMPVLDDGVAYEVWISDKPVVESQNKAISGSCNEDIFFGSVFVQPDPSMHFSEVVQRAYSDIFAFLERSTYAHLIRVWNYFPDINALEDGMERYRSFSIGRQEAFVRYGRKIEESPAACALGSHGGSLAIYFLAARTPGAQIENPRQISAYHYPEQYGPRSPAFSRATLAFADEAPTLFISGTASILGHETVHPGSVSLQTHETLNNIRAVIDQAGRDGFKIEDLERGLTLKAYVRHAEHMTEVRDIICGEWGAKIQLIVVLADICRVDLLVEIEAVCRGDSNK